MPNYLTCEANLDFPGPTIEQVVAQVLAHYKHNRPVTTIGVAVALGADKGIVAARLNQAFHCRLISRVPDRGWIPLVK